MRICILFAFCCLTFNGFSQSFRVSGIVLANSSDKVSAIYNDGFSYTGTIEGGLQWGGTAEYLFNEKYGVEFSFQNYKTTLPISFTTGRGTGERDYALRIGWWMLKCNRYFGQKSNKFQGFAGIGAGANIAVAHNYWAEESSEAYLAFQANTGVIYWVAKPVGLKLNVQYQYSPKGTGDVFLFGDKSVGAKSSSSISQFGLGLGLVFVLDGLANTK